MASGQAMAVRWPWHAVQESCEAVSVYDAMHSRRTPVWRVGGVRKDGGGRTMHLHRRGLLTSALPDCEDDWTWARSPFTHFAALLPKVLKLQTKKLRRIRVVAAAPSAFDWRATVSHSSDSTAVQVMVYTTYSPAAS